MASLISPGTERAALDFGEGNLLQKIRRRPDLARQVIDKARRDGVLEAVRTAAARLQRPVPLGYACAGRVMAVGDLAGEFAVGDRVACGGAGYATHAEMNYVPRNLVVPIPRPLAGEWLSYEEACFATLGAVALHGVRLGGPGIGERVAVIGLGLIGQLTQQILRANGCVVVGVDTDESRCALALDLGIDDAARPDRAVERVRALTRGLGVDRVFLTASSSDSRPLELAGDIARDRATIVAVGATGLEVPRRSFYEKELSVVVSRSYGPGRYDPNFEERGEDYPIGYVRWTERENLRAFLELVASRRVVVGPLITHRVPIEEADRAYGLLKDGSALGIVLEYAQLSEGETRGRALPRIELRREGAPLEDTVGVSVVGAGTFAQDVLLPALKKVSRVERRGIVTASGITSRAAGTRFGFVFCASDLGEIWSDARTRAVIIVTRNHLHARFAAEAMTAGKAVFVEKPLAISEAQLEELLLAYRRAEASGQRPLLMVGFNRRFAPLVGEVRRFFEKVKTPVSVHYRVNAGRLPARSWVADPRESGGRIVSEMCHFVDLASFLAASPPVSVFARRMGGEEDVHASLTFENGAIASIGYYCGGDRSFSKERLEVFGGGAVAVVDDFRRGWLISGGRHRRLGGWWARQRKGHREELQAFIDAVTMDRPSPVSFDEVVTSTRATFAIVDSLKREEPIAVGG
jgi:predicted dehydrogenase